MILNEDIYRPVAIYKSGKEGLEKVTKSHAWKDDIKSAELVIQAIKEAYQETGGTIDIEAEVTAIKTGSANFSVFISLLRVPAILYRLEEAANDAKKAAKNRGRASATVASAKGKSAAASEDETSEEEPDSKHEGNRLSAASVVPVVASEQPAPNLRRTSRVHKRKLTSDWEQEELGGERKKGKKTG
jgi:phytoene dehydrogenase-like protein